MQADCTRRRQKKERGVSTTIFDFEDPKLSVMTIKKLKIIKRVKKDGLRYVIFKDIKKMCIYKNVYIKINCVLYFKFSRLVADKYI